MRPTSKSCSEYPIGSDDRLAGGIQPISKVRQPKPALERRLWADNRLRRNATVYAHRQGLGIRPDATEGCTHYRFPGTWR